MEYGESDKNMNHLVVFWFYMTYLRKLNKTKT